MFNHAPKDYKCPLCLAVKGIESKDTMVKQADIFYKDNLVFAMISSKFVGNNPGHILVVPNKHYENIYDIPATVSHQISDVAQKLAIALKKVRQCEGVTTLQNNEPAGNQHAFHYHFHVFPRFKNDELHKNMLSSWVSSDEERKPFSNALKKYFKSSS
jgi:histidine triad (HIT) family protein